MPHLFDDFEDEELSPDPLYAGIPFDYDRDIHLLPETGRRVSSIQNPPPPGGEFGIDPQLLAQSNLPPQPTEPELSHQPTTPELPPQPTEREPIVETPISFPADRDPFLPHYYESLNHPLWPHGRTYVYHYDTSPESQKKYAAWSVKLKVPLGKSGAELNAMGLLRLYPGDAVFVRSYGGDRNRYNDHPKAWVTGEGKLERIIPGGLNRVKAVAKQILGDPNLRTLDRPKEVNGVLKGGIHFERDAHINHTKQGPRCYGGGVSVQVPRDNLSQPCHNAAGKGEHQRLRDEFTILSAEVVAAALNQGPRKHIEMCKLRAELLNTPSIGQNSNFGFFSNLQINVAPAVPNSSTADMSDSLGTAGASHNDRLDDPLALTAMTAISDTPEDYEDGNFHLLELGVYVRMTPYTVVIFSGLQTHGGSPPRAPPGFDVKPWATRVTVIWYPSDVFLNRKGNTSLAFDEELGVIENSIAKSTHWRPTFAELGPNIMQPAAFRRYLAREALVLVYKIFQTSPPSVRLSINPDAFFKAITFVNENGERETIEPWDLAPGGERDGERKDLLCQVTDYSDEATSFIPLKAVKLQESDERAKRKRIHDGSPEAKRRKCSKTTTKRLLCSTPALLLHLTPGAFRATRKCFEFAYTASGSPALLAVHANEPFPANELNRAAKLLQSDSGGLSTFKRISELMRMCGRTSEATHELQVLVRLNRAQIMHAIWLTGNWLYIDCAAYIKDYIGGQVMVTGDYAWLQSLTSTIWRHFFIMSKDKTVIQPSAYGFHDPNAKPFFIQPARYGEADGVVVACVLDCLASFLMPDLPEWRHQSAFVDELLKLTKSPGIMLLDPVYTAFEDIWASFSDPKKRQDMDGHLDVLKDGLPSLLTREVEEDLLLITQMAEKFVPGFASYGSSAFGEGRSAAPQEITSNSQAGPSSIPYDAVIPDHFNSPGERNSTMSIFQASSSVIPPESDLPLPSLLPPNPTTGDMAVYTAAERVVLFLRSAYKIYRRDAKEIQDPVTIFLMDTKKNPRDSFLPFREKAPSRTAILVEPSPYQPENVRRCVGFFGAVIFRAVTFKCGILLEKNHRLFGSLDEWLSLVDNYLDKGRGDDFFCDRCAYGPTDKRGRQFVPEFWPPATEWEKYLLEHPNLSFIELFEYIDRLNMPSVGALTSYLIATDFAYADLVPFPSPTEVATAIIKLGAGARHGLEKLKVWTTKKKGTKKKRIKKKKGDDDNEIARFVLLHDKVKALLSPEEQVNMGYDTLMLEHTLCKLSKMTKLKEIKNRVLNDL